MATRLLLTWLLCPLLALAQGDSASVRITARPDTVREALTLGAEMDGIGTTVRESEGGMPGGTSLTARGAAFLRIDQSKWNGTASFDVLREAGTRFDRWAEAGYDRRSGAGTTATRWRTRWTWTPSESITLQAGRDTLHEGYGHRSLFRGGHAAPAPFLQVVLDGGGRLRYRHRVEALQGDMHLDCWTGETGDPRTWVPPTGPLRSRLERGVVSHRLELDLGPRITGALWGAVVWNLAEGQRGFEPHYLLPLTSLRPTEYGQGSADNALVGVEGRWKLGKGGAERPRHLYGQFLLDELIVSELLGGTEWWGNKYGLLGGLLWTTRWGGWRLEGSAVRPWTYSHYTRSSAYLQGLTPVAHPLGANFVEGTFNGHWTHGDWTVQGRLTHSLRGDDTRGDEPTGSLPQIGDIARTADQYGWLAGTARKRWMGVVDVGRQIDLGRDMAITAYAQWALATEIGGAEAFPTRESWLSLGLRSAGPFFGADW